MIAFITFVAVATLSLLGMFYWMWRAKSGTLHLKSDSWHVKLLNWMWDVDILQQATNACPYYWSIVCSVVVLPTYLALYAIFRVFGPVYVYIRKHTKGWFTDIKGYKWMDRIPHVPTNVQEVYGTVYRSGKSILIDLLSIVGVVLCIVFVVAVFVFPYLAMSITTAVLVTALLLWIVGAIVLSIGWPEYDQYHTDYYADFVRGLGGILLVPFRLLWWILSTIIGKVFDVASNNCPPIEWEK